MLYRDRNIGFCTKASNNRNSFSFNHISRLGWFPAVPMQGLTWRYLQIEGPCCDCSQNKSPTIWGLSGRP